MGTHLACQPLGQDNERQGEGGMNLMATRNYFSATSRLEQVSLDDLKPKRRPFQFSLRKLLLWTTVWSVYLGVVRWAGMSLSTAVSVTVCLVILFSARIKWGFERGLRFWNHILCAAVFIWLGAFFLFGIWQSNWTASLMMGFPPFDWLIGAVLGIVGFTGVHLVAKLVAWLDNLMATKPPQEPG
jgi:hypothetical protein